MNRNYCFEYNIAYVTANPTSIELSEKYFSKHLTVLTWLEGNLESHIDYEWVWTAPSRELSRTQVAAWYLYFAREEDLLAFRLACGL